MYLQNSCIPRIVTGVSALVNMIIDITLIINIYVQKMQHLPTVLLT
jgi:hypothetical protein